MKHTLTLGPFVFLCLLVLSVVVRGQSPQAKHPLYALPEVLETLNGGISPKQFVTLVSEYGVDFRLNDESENKIRAACGNDSLVIAIAKSFKEKIAATPRVIELALLRSNRPVRPDKSCPLPAPPHFLPRPESATPANSTRNTGAGRTAAHSAATQEQHGPR